MSAASKKRVLVVDDEEGIRQVLRRFLEGQGYEVVAASGGEEALRLEERQPADAMLLDLFMPGLSGLDVLLRVKQSRPELPVIMLTANADESIAKSALTMGAYDYLMKPIDFNQLQLTLQAKLIG